MNYYYNKQNQKYQINLVSNKSISDNNTNSNKDNVVHTKHKSSSSTLPTTTTTNTYPLPPGFEMATSSLPDSPPPLRYNNNIDIIRRTTSGNSSTSNTSNSNMSVMDNSPKILKHTLNINNTNTNNNLHNTSFGNESITSATSVISYNNLPNYFPYLSLSDNTGLSIPINSPTTYPSHNSKEGIINENEDQGYTSEETTTSDQIITIDNAISENHDINIHRSNTGSMDIDESSFSTTENKYSSTNNNSKEEENNIIIQPGSLLMIPSIIQWNPTYNLYTILQEIRNILEYYVVNNVIKSSSSSLLSSSTTLFGNTTTTTTSTIATNMYYSTTNDDDDI